MLEPNDLYQLAQSPAGQQLLAMLQKNGGKELQDAVVQASAGNYTQAQKTLSALLSTPEAQKLIEQMGGSK